MKLELNESIIKDIYTCASCGFCRFGCPVSHHLGFESRTVRGRMHLLKNVVEGKLDYEEDLIESIYKCALCPILFPIVCRAYLSIEIVTNLREYFVK